MKAKQVERPTQRQLRELGLSQSYASELLSGKKQPSLRTAMLIQTKLGYPVDRWQSTDYRGANGHE